MDAEVVSIRRSARKVTVPKLLVDSGSEYTWVPEAMLKRANIQIVRKDLPFLMANEQTITRSVGYAIVRVAGLKL